jgi:hypothetical protein
MDDRRDKLGEIVAGALPGSVIGYRVANGELTVDRRGRQRHRQGRHLPA